MVAGKFTWVKPDVYPLIAAVAVGCTMGTYLSIRNFWTSPGVEWQKDLRKADIKSDVDTYSNMAVTYKNTGLYRNLSKYLSPHMGTKDELYLQDNHGKPTTQYQHN